MVQVVCRWRKEAIDLQALDNILEPPSTPPKHSPVALSSSLIQLIPLPTTLSTLTA